MTTTPVAGPDGSEHQLIRCTDTEDCYSKAADICHGPYQIVDSGTRNATTGTNGNVWSMSTKEVLVRCGGESAPADKQKSGAIVRHDPKSDDSGPKDAAGFSFGSPIEDVEKACTEASFEWKQEGSRYRCTGTPVETGLGASARLTFCDQDLCKIEVVVPPKADDTKQLATDLERVVAALSKRYGKPTEHDIVYPSQCFAEALPSCLSQGMAHFWYVWEWLDRKKVTLALGSRKPKPESDESKPAKPDGTANGAAAVTMRIRYDDGRIPKKPRRAESAEGSAPRSAEVEGL